MTFLSASFLTGLILATVPIIIHILNRRRFLVIDWPPMKYLKLTLKKNRRRIRIEQMILLAMRTLAVILLMLAVARPLLSQKAISSLLPGRARTSRVLVIDDSLSMGYTTAGHTAFQSAQNAAGELIRAAGSQDSVTVLVTSAPQQPVVHEVAVQQASALAGVIAGLSQTDTASNWTTIFSGIQSALAGATFPNKEVAIVTDFRRAGWSAEVATMANKLAADHVSVRLIDVGDRRTDDVALLSFELEDSVALPFEPIHLLARVRNRTAAMLTAAPATLSVNGDNRPVLLPDIPPGATVDVPLTVNLENAGAYALSLSLPKDALPGDDVRYLTLNVRPTISVLMLDGQPSAQPFESETDFLTLSYTVGAQPWNVQTITEFDPRRYRVGSANVPDVMVLANVASLSPEAAAGLEELVDNGMGLMIFTGELVDPSAYNQRLYKEGKGLLPARLDRAVDTPTAGLAVEKDPQSPLAALGKLAPEALARVRTRRFTELLGMDNPDPGVSVLARWNNAQNPPAIVAKKFGKGRVVLFTTTAGKAWTDWPLDSTFMLTVRSTARSIARGQEGGANLSAGDLLSVTLPEGQAAIDPKIGVPGATTPDAVDVERVGTVTRLRYAKTFHAGIYTLTWRDEKSTPVTRPFAVSSAASESELEPLDETQLSDYTGNLKPVVQRYGTNGIGFGTPPRELWRPLAMILLGLLAAETVFAAWVGRER